ncbi:MAG: Ribosomal protein methylthiotransferase rimO [Armatimonadetes bacterium]|jgi:ribosomal protein S12 methylthiotransferase|nr:Ribosomal protein methylthiotransferase rimO [Armatimonadota bacterium]
MADKVALINLGCPKNLVDSEVMLGHLRDQGYELTGDMDLADVVVVNTCGFLQDAAQESVNTLLEAAQRKKDGKLRAVVAAGCMTQRYGDDVAAAMPEVDGFLGVGQGHALPDVVRRALAGERPSVLTGPSAGFEGYGLRLQSTPSYTAYLKVSEGCDRKCAFCIIPQIRGDMVSRTLDAIVREAEVLAAQGTREIILIGQDPNRYGVDLPRSAGSSAHLLPELLARLNQVKDLRWIRVMYLFPDRHVVPILEAIAALPKVCKYVDMPVQHTAPEIVRAMNRPGSGQEYLRILENLRGVCPDVSIRSTYIVGFPGETEAHFEELLDFARAVRFDWGGVFRYSVEEGTTAAEMDGQISRRVSKDRYHRLMELQQSISTERQRRWVGRQVEVLVERVDGSTAVGRTQGQSPEIDGETHLNIEGVPGTRPGDFVLAEVTGSTEYDLQGKALELLHRAPLRAPGLLQIGVMS